MGNILSASDSLPYTVPFDNCREGFIQGLAEEGFVEGENLTILYENANADGGTSSQIITNFISKKADLICGIATPIAQSAYSVARKTGTPVIYTAVTDPVMAELANADGSPVGEVTGTSDKLPVTEQLQMIREASPMQKNRNHVQHKRFTPLHHRRIQSSGS